MLLKVEENIGDFFRCQALLGASLGKTCCLSPQGSVTHHRSKCLHLAAGPVPWNLYRLKVTAHQNGFTQKSFLSKQRRKTDLTKKDCKTSMWRMSWQILVQKDLFRVSPYPQSFYLHRTVFNFCRDFSLSSETAQSTKWNTSNFRFNNALKYI